MFDSYWSHLVIFSLDRRWCLLFCFPVLDIQTQVAFLVSKDNTRESRRAPSTHVFSPLFPLLIHPKETMRKTVKLKLTFSWKTLMNGLLPVCFPLPPNMLCCAARRNRTPHPMPGMAACQTEADKMQPTFAAKLFLWVWWCSFHLMQDEPRTFTGRKRLLCLWRQRGVRVRRGKGRQTGAGLRTRHWKRHPRSWAELCGDSMGSTITGHQKVISVIWHYASRTRAHQN